jgi:endonuclease YncB( thermonuclease family)
MGTLRVTGVIDIHQFWPLDSSDADTTKLKLEVSKGSFKYRKTGSKTFKTTNVYVGAVSKGQGTKEVITTSKRTGIKFITCRLQGVDAPELHYKASALKTKPSITQTMRDTFNKNNAERRQYYAQSSTVALEKHLKKFADKNGMVKAVFETEVDSPADAVDTYGRFIGNIRIGRSLDINIWLVENGWGHPAFYTSMSNEEINAFLKVWKKGKNKSGRPSRSLSKDVSIFNWKLLYDEPKAGKVIKFKLGEDKGKVLMPKIYRRQVAWLVSKKAKVIDGAMKFSEYLKEKPDQLVLLQDFLQNGLNSSEVKNLHDFFVKNKITKNPEELVFKEKPGTVVDANGTKVENW